MISSRTLLQLSRDFLDLALTLQPQKQERPFIKVFGRPQFSGGPATKLEHLQKISAAKSMAYNSVFCLSSISIPLQMLKILKSRGAKILVSQNGVYYPAWYSGDWQKKNDYLRRLNELSDHTFFQSQFALRSFEYWVGRPPSRHSILYNGVDLDRFFPSKDSDSSRKLRFLVFSDVSKNTFALWKHVLALILKVSGPITWILAGQIKDQAIFENLQRHQPQRCEQENIEKHFNLGHALVPNLLRSCDLALHLVYNDVCPNKVLECLASGIYVIGTSAGGTAELLGDGGKVIKVREGYDDPQYPTHEDLLSSIEFFMQNRHSCKKAARGRAEQFSIKTWHRAIEEIGNKL